ncbi:MAG TPA: YdeI/OmpD-associated family protein, partial [Thermoanaerobaculia bacterium]|nr:YdeI/OmpD-associated family protein [Thermoanaerobaculia bacterium]
QYSFENAPRDLPPEYEKRFRAKKKAWAHFGAQPPGYRRVAIWYVVSAKKEETRVRRLAALIDCSERGERLPQIAATSKPAPKVPGKSSQSTHRS